MALDAGTAFVTILPNTAKFGPALTGEVTKATSAAEKRTQAFGKAAAVGLGLAAVAAVKFGADSVAAYRESQEVLAQLQNTISHTAGYTDDATAAFQKQATALQSLTGYEDEQILSADNALIRFKLTQDQVSSLIPLILDYARATGTDAVSASENIGKALLGNTRALKTIGIEYHATGDRAKDLANIEDLLKAKVGGAAEAFGQTSQGKIAIFQAKLNDLQETIGKALIPVLDAIVTALSVVVGIFSKLPGPVQATAVVVTALGIAFVGLGLALRVVRSSLQGYTGQAVQATVATEGLATAEAEAAAATGAAGGGGLAGVMAGLGPIAIAASAAIAGLSVEMFLNAKAADAAKKGNESAARGWTALGGIVGGIAGILTGATHANEDISGSAHVASTNIAKFRDSLASVPSIAERAGVVVDHTAQRLNQLGNMARVKGSEVVDAILAAGRAATHASDDVKTLHTQIVELPNGKQVVITLPGLAEVRASLRALHSEVLAIAGTYGITYVIHTQGHAPIGHLAEGGIFRAAQGFTFQAGEASYPTPLGPGAEIVSNRGVEPLANDHLDRIGDRVAQRIGADGGSTKAAFKEALWDMRELFGPRVVSVQINRREIARAVADQEAWDR